MNRGRFKICSIFFRSSWYFSSWHGVWKSQKKSNSTLKVKLHLHFEWTKVNLKRHKWSNLASFWKPEACGQIVLPDSSILIEPKIGGKSQNWINNVAKSNVRNHIFCKDNWILKSKLNWFKRSSKCLFSQSITLLFHVFEFLLRHEEGSEEPSFLLCRYRYTTCLVHIIA